MEWIGVGADGKEFIREPSGRSFTPWGFNYDHDEQGRLIEDYWDAEWPKIESDFAEMKNLGANVVRIHLQFGKFMRGPTQPDPHALGKLLRLVKLAERTGLYLNLTGLACYHKADVPPWYDALSETERWSAQARFWEAIAAQCANRPAIFCYDLMNEPVVPGGDGRRDDWLAGAFAAKHFVQFIALERAGRARPDVARAWIQQLTTAIRKHDRRHLITVGLVHWSLDKPGLTSGFVPEKTVGDLDFISVHLYPVKSAVDEALATLREFAVGKPVVLEETFPLRCSREEFADFMLRSRDVASGWFGFYWGKTPEECRAAGTIGDAMMLNWLEFFQTQAPQFVRP